MPQHLNKELSTCHIKVPVANSETKLVNIATGVRKREREEKREGGILT